MGQRPHPDHQRDAARRVQGVRLRQGHVRVLVRGVHADQARHVRQHRGRPRRTGTARSSGTASTGQPGRPTSGRTPSRKGTTRMEQYEPDRLSPAQVAAMRRSFTNGRAALTRRSLLRASAGGALAARRPRCAERLRHPRGRQDRGRRLRRRPLGQGEDRQLLQLDRVHGRRREREAPPHARRVHRADRHQGQVHRGHQRQRRVLRQDQAAARGGPGHRPRPHRPHRLAGRPADPPRLGPETGPVQPPARVREPVGTVPQPRLGPRPRLLATPGRASRPSSPTTRRPSTASR